MKKKLISILIITALVLSVPVLTFAADDDNPFRYALTSTLVTK